MSVGHSDFLDECCQALKGHDNWGYFHAMTAEEKKKALKDENVTIVVFWDEEAEEAEDEN